ncbi:MAG TPA: hypothetical protein PKL31_01640 [Fulvivirga sp.]|nr:hypothetical protein [Fulvivirga sp.]
MSEFEKKRLDQEFQKFTKRNFESPKRCKNLDQIRFYVQELSSKMEEFKNRFNYVPSTAYSLLSQYNTIQNKIVFTNFKNSY